MTAKPKLAVYWAASCGGCDIATLAVDEKILDVAEAFDIVLWPCIMDGKVSDVEALADGELAVTLWNGGVRSSEHEHMARLLRRKSRLLVAFGSCAQEGCIPGLANLHTRDEIFAAVYADGSPTLDNPKGVVPLPEWDAPEGKLHLPVFYDTLKTLDQTVAVDYTVPGCPPEAERIAEVFQALLAGQLPPPGSIVGALPSTVCDTCTRTRAEKRITAFKRTWQVIPDTQACLLEQGLVCCGVATRAGCGARCPTVNSPCIGCYGPPAGTQDQGARLMSALASVIESDDPAQIDRIVSEGIPDPVGTFYRFGLARSLLRRRARPAAGTGA
jgi:F420-non-reducing hydrogenase small subunit